MNTIMDRIMNTTRNIILGIIIDKNTRHNIEYNNKYGCSLKSWPRTIALICTSCN